MHRISRRLLRLCVALRRFTSENASARPFSVATNGRHSATEPPRLAAARINCATVPLTAEVGGPTSAPGAGQAAVSRSNAVCLSPASRARAAEPVRSVMFSLTSTMRWGERTEDDLARAAQYYSSPGWTSRSGRSFVLCSVTPRQPALCWMAGLVSADQVPPVVGAAPTMRSQAGHGGNGGSAPFHGSAVARQAVHSRITPRKSR